MAATRGYLDSFEIQEIADVEERLQQTVLQDLPDLEQEILSGKTLSEDDMQLLAESIHRVVKTVRE
jgi:F0F1-type ATP synthase alpha subunit